MKKSVLLLSISVLAFAAPSVATPILDQESPYEESEFDARADIWHWQQEVTVGLQGLLVQIDLYGRASGSAELSIYVGEPWQSGAPDFVDIIGCSHAWNSINVSSAGLVFDVGDKFVIGVSGINDHLRLGGNFGFPSGAYEGGELWEDNTPFEVFDLAFRTWVVPEPTTIAFLGLGGLALLRKRRPTAG